VEFPVQAGDELRVPRVAHLNPPPHNTHARVIDQRTKTSRVEESTDEGSAKREVRLRTGMEGSARSAGSAPPVVFRARNPRWKLSRPPRRVGAKAVP
jgi:hypothetical protein